MSSSTRRALALAAGCVTLLSAAACTGRNDGTRSAYGGSSDGEGGSPPAGPRAGQSTDTTTAPEGATTPTAAPAPGAAATPGASARPDSAKGAS